MICSRKYFAQSLSKKSIVIERFSHANQNAQYDMNFRLIRESSRRSRDSFDDVFCDRNNSAACCIILMSVTFMKDIPS
jgi:hypothetical protein